MGAGLPPTPPSSSFSQDTLPLPGCSMPALGYQDGQSHLLFVSTLTLSTLSGLSPPARAENRPTFSTPGPA